MNLSLREARKLETRIQSKINEGIVEGRAFNIHESFLSDEMETIGWLEETFAMADDSVAAMLGLVSARSSIRRDVQAINERAGINTLISQRKELISLRQVWQSAVSGYDKENGHAMTAEVMTKMAETAAESAKLTSSRSTMYGGRTDTITVASISDEMYEQAMTQSRELLRMIDNVEDKLAGLNATTKIELESTLVDFLEEQDLV